MSISLGGVPDSLTINLTTDSDFTQTLESTDADGSPVDWQVGETVTIVFDDGTEWAADLTGNVASWNLDKTEVQTLIAIPTRSAKLIYTADDLDVVWATGTVTRR